MFTKLILKIFKLHDISEKLIKAKQQQKRVDDKYWSEKLADFEEKMKREHELEIQEYQAQIEILNQKLKDYKKREKDIDTREYYLRKQANDNTLMATKITSKVEDFGMAIIKIVGEMKGIKKEVEDHKVKIEGKPE